MGQILHRPDRHIVYTHQYIPWNKGGAFRGAASFEFGYHQATHSIRQRDRPNRDSKPEWGFCVEELLYRVGRHRQPNPIGDHRVDAGHATVYIRQRPA
jgi:hypothetical protein